MNPTSRHAVRIAEPTTGPTSRAGKQFNTLIKKLESMRKRLAEWKDALPAVMSQNERDYIPLVNAYMARERRLVLLLDQNYQHKLLGKRERDKLARLICATVLDLLEQEDDAELKEVYNRYSGRDFDAEETEGKAQVREMIESMLGMKFDGDIDLRSPETVLEAFSAQLEQQGAPPPPSGDHEAPRKKHASELARERRQAAEAERLQQSMRDIYRKLVSQLHPDREPDPAERQRKTALMQRVNVAYAANDMLGLLELQLEVEQIDQAGLANLGEARIKQYNKILNEQLRELEREVEVFEDMAAMEMGCAPFTRVTPASIASMLEDDIADMRQRIAAIDVELEEFTDIKKLKAWLKTYRPPAPQREDDLFW